MLALSFFECFLNGFESAFHYIDFARIFNTFAVLLSTCSPVLTESQRPSFCEYECKGTYYELFL
jgi:hypothetical protein